MTNSLADIELDDEIAWTDELDWTPIEQSLSRGQTGHMIVQEGTKVGGRPLTLTMTGTRATVDLLRAQLTTAQLPLVLYGTTYTVRWRHADKPIEATPLVDYVNPAAMPDLEHAITLRLIEV
jgi:hypothetical protein